METLIPYLDKAMAVGDLMVTETITCNRVFCTWIAAVSVVACIALAKLTMFCGAMHEEEGGEWDAGAVASATFCALGTMLTLCVAIPIALASWFTPYALILQDITP